MLFLGLFQHEVIIYMHNVIIYTYIYIIFMLQSTLSIYLNIIISKYHHIQIRFFKAFYLGPPEIQLH